MIKPVEFFFCQCDNCGKAWYNEYYLWSAMSDESSLEEMITDEDWQIGNQLKDEKHVDKHYCPSCYEYDDNDNFILKPKTK